MAEFPVPSSSCVSSIAWLATHDEQTSGIRHGLVAAGLGDSGRFHYKRSRRGDAPIDFAVPRALRRLGEEPIVEPFVPFGYDERTINRSLALQSAVRLNEPGLFAATLSSQ